MPYFTEWQGLSVYSGKVKSHNPSNDILSFFNLENIRNILNYGPDKGEMDVDSIISSYTVRYALNYILKNMNFIFDRNLINFIRSNEYSNIVGKHELNIHRMFNSDFILMYLNPNVYKDFGCSNDPSYYHLFLSLLDSVNSVILESSEHNLAELKISCENIDFCLYTKVSEGYIKDILTFYKQVGAIDLNEDYVFNFNEVRGLAVLDGTRLTNVGSSTTNIGFSFSPSGFLIPYHLGVLSYLCEYNAINCTVALAGASSGSLSVCSSVVLNGFVNCMNVVENASKRLIEIHKKKSDEKSAKDKDGKPTTMTGRLDDIVNSVLSEILGEGCYEFINNRIGALTISYSVIRQMRFKSVSNSYFSSVADLINCLRVSSYIPIVSSNDFVYYKGEPCFDGQLSLNKSLGCPDTDAERTIRINPYNFTSGTITKQMLMNEYITPNLSRNDHFLIYYIRLKSIMYQLNIRKLTLKKLNVLNEFKNELIYSINLYNHFLSNSKFKLDKSKSIMYTETREYVKLNALWNSKSMLDLFIIVTDFEINFDVDKYNVRKYEVTDNMDIIKSLGSSKLLKKPIKTSPVTLLTYLYLQLSEFSMPSITEKTSDNISSFISYYSIICSPDQTGNSSRNVHNLVNFLTLLIPPLTLVYNYCSCNWLISNNVPKKKLFNMSLYSSDDFHLRFFYDLGKTDAYRWMIQEYIKFENYLYLKTLQLMKFDNNNNNSFNLLENIDTASNTDKLIHNKQKELITKNFNLLRKENLNHQPLTDSVHYRLFLNLNNAVRNAIMENIIDSHFSHILSHSHLWNYNKHYRF